MCCHRSILLLPTCIVFGVGHALYCLPIRNVSMISLFTCTPTPGSGNASTIILTMLISKRKGLTLLQNKILPEACNFFLSGVFTVKGLLCALGILTVPVISPEYLQCNGKMLSSHPSLYHLSKYLCCFCGKFFLSCLHRCFIKVCKFYGQRFTSVCFLNY